MNNSKYFFLTVSLTTLLFSQLSAYVIETQAHKEHEDRLMYKRAINEGSAEADTSAKSAVLMKADNVEREQMKDAAAQIVDNVKEAKKDRVEKIIDNQAAAAESGEYDHSADSDKNETNIGSLEKQQSNNEDKITDEVIPKDQGDDKNDKTSEKLEQYQSSSSGENSKMQELEKESGNEPEKGSGNEPEQESEKGSAKESEKEPEKQFKKPVEKESEKESERESEMGSQMEPEKQPDKEFEKQPERESEKQSAKESQEGSQKEPEKESEKEPEKESENQPDKESEKQPEKESEKQPEKESEKQPGKQSGNQPENQPNKMDESNNTHDELTQNSALTQSNNEDKKNYIENLQMDHNNNEVTETVGELEKNNGKIEENKNVEGIVIDHSSINSEQSTVNAAKPQSVNEDLTNNQNNNNNNNIEVNEPSINLEEKPETTSNDNHLTTIDTKPPIDDNHLTTIDTKPPIDDSGSLDYQADAPNMGANHIAENLKTSTPLNMDNTMEEEHKDETEKEQSMVTGSSAGVTSTASNKTSTAQPNEVEDSNNELAGGVMPNAATAHDANPTEKPTSNPIVVQSCYTCGSANDSDCITKPSKSVNCKNTTGDGNGCYTLVKVDSKTTTRGCITDLTVEDMSYCKSHSKLCELCYDKDCNNRLVPSSGVRFTQKSMVAIFFICVVSLLSN